MCRGGVDESLSGGQRRLQVQVQGRVELPLG